MGDFWGLRSKSFIAWKPKYRRQRMTELPTFNREPPVSKFLKRLGIILGKMYILTLGIYLLWNLILIEKIKDLKPVTVFESFALLMLLNFIRTPKYPVSVTLDYLLADEEPRWKKS